MPLAMATTPANQIHKQRETLAPRPPQRNVSQAATGRGHTNGGVWHAIPVKTSGIGVSSKDVCCHETAKAPSDVMGRCGWVPRFGVG